MSAELFLAQGRGEPARTQAPEPFRPDGIAVLNDAFAKRFGVALFRAYPEPGEVFKACHRFKALSESGLYGLAKDLVGVVVEHIDAAALQKIAPPPGKENWGSLKSLEKVLATVIGEKQAHAALGALHGMYNLRLADAHVFSKDELDEAYTLAHVDRALPFVMQGRDLLITCVNSLHLIADAMK